MNWGFGKKAVTMALYGLTAMGMFLCYVFFLMNQLVSANRSFQV